MRQKSFEDYFIDGKKASGCERPDNKEKKMIEKQNISVSKPNVHFFSPRKKTDQIFKMQSKNSTSVIFFMNAG